MPRKPDRTTDQDARPARPANGSGTGGDLRTVLDALPALVAYWGPDLRNRIANRRFVDYFGLTPEAMRGLHAREVFGPELYALNLPLFERALTGEHQRFERTVVDAAGSTRHLEASYVPDVVEGEVRGVTVLVTDITDRRLAEQALAAAEARFRLAFTRSPVGMALVDDTHRLLQANPALCRLLGYAADELSAHPFTELVAPEMRSDERERLTGLFGTSARAASSECRLVRKDGSTIWVILSIALAPADDASAAFGIVHVQDIAARKAAEDELELSRARLVEAERVARMGSWEWDLRAGRATWSAGLLEIYGLTATGFDPSREALEERVFPDDRERVRQAIDRALRERSSFALEYRAVRLDGRVRTLRARGEVVVDDAGEPFRLVGIVHDVTDERETQAALQAASADLERRALDLQRLVLRSGSEPDSAPPVLLTTKQLEILRLVAQGMSNADIADRLFIAESTVKWHMRQILVKTGAANRAEAVARVLGAGVDEPPE